MEEYISKSALVAELKRLQDALQDPAMKRESMQDYAHGGNKIVNEIRSFLNTLKTKEVDLEKALSDLDKDIKEFITTEEFERESETYGHYWAIAKHAFLLGLEAQKRE